MVWRNVAGNAGLVNSLPWRSAIGIFAIAAACTFGFHSIQTTRNSDKLTMRVRQNGDRLLLSWDRDNSVVHSSLGGVLHIDDGAQHRSIPLDSALLLSGSVLYRPVTGDVAFELEVHGRKGELVDGSLRIVDGSETTIPAIPAYPLNVKTKPLPAPQKLRNTALAPLEDAKQISESKPIIDNQTSPGELAALRPTGLGVPQQEPVLVAHSVEKTSELGEEPTPGDTTKVATTSNAEPPAPVPTEITPEPQNVFPSAPKVQPKSAVVTLPPASSAENAAPAVVPPRPLREVMPDLRRLGATPTLSTPLRVEVSVRVDQNGNVTEAHLISGRNKPPPYVAFAALSAAKQWTFQPATVRGQKIVSEHAIVFNFGPRQR